MAVKLYDILIRSALEELKYQKNNGAFPPGYNGPYNDTETPVRNTSHWIIILLKAYRISDDKEFIFAAEKAIDFLLSEEARPMEAAFWHRKKPEKDFSNGLIGQAWTIESLVYTGKELNRPELIKLGTEVFLQHDFNHERGGWRILNVDGSYNDFDYTFNHQLWFAAVGGLLYQAGADEVLSSVQRFMDKLKDHLELYSNGLIVHRSSTILLESRKQKLKAILRGLKVSKENKDYLRMKSIGYHGFNLYAFAMLYNVFPDHSFWDSTKMKNILDYAQSYSYRKSIKGNKYGFPYNPPGFEIGYALQQFQVASKSEISEWVTWQLEECYDFESNRMTKQAHDSKTAAARLYEATRLENYQLDI